MSEIESSMLSAFRDAANTASEDIIPSYERETDASKIADELSLDSFTDVVDDISDSLGDVFIDAGENAFASLDINDDELFGLVSEDARSYADARGAELVGKKWVDGELVDNPNAEWAITESTRDGLRTLIESAYSDGMTPANLAKEIQQSYLFSSDRAKLVARTETARASIQGSLAGWKRSGVVEGKSSILSDDHDLDDECDENEDAGVIAIDDDFPSGDDGPPYHPGCNCALVAELVDEGDEI